jgi:hypothetical protein
MEVAHPIILVMELRELSEEDAEVIHLSGEMEINIREALGISLFEVQSRYFSDSDIGNDLVEEWNYEDVIENHDRVPFAEYSSDA